MRSRPRGRKLRAHRRWALLAIALLAACSGGEGEDGEVATAPTTSVAVSSTEPPTFTGDPGSPLCELLREVDPTTILAGDSEDPVALEAGFQRLVEVFDQLRALAPPAIAPDAALIADGLAALDEALAAVGYDFEALAASEIAPDVVAAVNDPAFTAAGDRLAAYRTQVCQL